MPLYVIELTAEEPKLCFSDNIFGRISEAADELELKCYMVGGYVCDIFLQRPSRDIDVVVVGSDVVMTGVLTKRLGRGTHLSVFRNFGTARLKYHGVEVEFIGAHKESYTHDSRKPVVEDGSLEDDQSRRDFAISALAICLNRQRYEELVDLFGGMEDVRKKTIHMPLDPDTTFSDDPPRMMHCIHSATQLNFYIDSNTFESLCHNKEYISIISEEHITDELSKILLSPVPSKGLIDLDRSELLQLILPELVALQGVENRNGRAHKDNFCHTLEVLDSISKETDNLWLHWATLLCNIAKPVTKRWGPRAGWMFHSHSFIDEKMIPEIFRRMKLLMNEEMKYVQKLVDLHVRPIVITDDVVTGSAARRPLFEAGDDIDDLMILCEAGITSRNMECKQRFLSDFQLVRQKLKDSEGRDRIRSFQPPVSGKGIMKTFNLPPYRRVGTLRSAVKDAILDDVIPNDYEAARAFMLQWAEKMGLKQGFDVFFLNVAPQKVGGGNRGL